MRRKAAIEGGGEQVRVNRGSIAAAYGGFPGGRDSGRHGVPGAVSFSVK
jgi:hypothetical protein